MKTVTVVAWLLLFVLSSTFSAARSVPSEIKAVTLFSNQALIKRQATVAVHKGLNEIQLAINTFRVDPDSVMATVFGAGEIFSVQYKEIPLAEAPQEKIKALLQEIDQLKSARRKQVDEKQALSKKEAFLNALIDFSRIPALKDAVVPLPDPQRLNQTLAFLGANYRKIYAAVRAADASISKLDDRIGVLKKELAALRGSTRQSQPIIEILFGSSKDQTIRIEARYLARNAGWQPIYKVSVSPSLADIELTMFSKITQKTGEDWKAVTLSVSNVIPLRGASLPTLRSWILDLPRPVRAKAGRGAADALKTSVPAAMQAEGLAAGAVPRRKAGFVQARRTRLPLSFEYVIGRPVSIESRDKQTLLPLFTKQIKGVFSHFCVPQKSPLTFLVARVASDKELLSGMLNVYFGGQYVGKTYLKEKKAGQPFELNLGADREVKVKREKIRDRSKETYFGKFQRDNVLRDLAYKITAENLKNKPVTLKIMDNIPVSKTDRIEVKDVKLTPEPGEKNVSDRKGVMLWQQQLNPGDKKEILIEFKVSYPKGISPAF